MELAPGLEGLRGVEVTDVEAGVVSPHGGGADDHRIALGSQAVRVRPGRRAGDPGAGAVTGRDASVEGRRQLHDHVRPTGATVDEVRRQLLGHRPGEHTGVDGDPRRPQHRPAGAGHPRVRVLDADHDPGHPGRDQGLDARPRPSGVGARLQRHVHRAAPSPITRGGQRGDLGVRAARRGRRTTSDHLPAGGDDAAHPRVRGRDEADAGRQGQRLAHVMFVDPRRVGAHA